MKHQPIPTSSFDPRLGTKDAWKAIAPEADKLNAIEARHGHMSRQYARQLGVVNALRAEDYRRNFFRKMGVEI